MANNTWVFMKTSASAADDVAQDMRIRGFNVVTTQIKGQCVIDFVSGNDLNVADATWLVVASRESIATIA